MPPKRPPQLPTVVHRRKNNASDQFPDPMAGEPPGGWERERLIQEWLANPDRDPNRDPRNFPYPVYPRDPNAGKVVIEIDDSSRPPPSAAPPRTPPAPAPPPAPASHYHRRGADQDRMNMNMNMSNPPVPTTTTTTTADPEAAIQAAVARHPSSVPVAPTVSMEQQIDMLRAQLAASTRMLETLQKQKDRAAEQVIEDQHKQETREALIHVIAPDVKIRRGPGRPPKPKFAINMTMGPQETVKDREVAAALLAAPVPHSSSSQIAVSVYYKWVRAETELGELMQNTRKFYMNYVARLLRFTTDIAITEHVTMNYKGTTARVIRTAWSRFYSWAAQQNATTLNGYWAPTIRGMEKSARAMPGPKLDMFRWQAACSMLMIRHAIPPHKLATVRVMDFRMEERRAILLLRGPKVSDNANLVLTSADLAAIEVMRGVVGPEYLAKQLPSAPLFQIRTSDGIEPAGEDRLRRALKWMKTRLDYVRETTSESCIHLLGWSEREARERVMHVIDSYLNHEQMGPQDYIEAAMGRLLNGVVTYAYRQGPPEEAVPQRVATLGDRYPPPSADQVDRAVNHVDPVVEARAVESELLPPSALLAMAKRAGSTASATVGDHDAPAAVIRGVSVARATVVESNEPVVRTTVADDEEVIEL